MDERQFRYTLKAAVDIAVLAHRDQMWGVYPYTTHLSLVHNTVIRFGFSDWTKELHQNLQIAAWLHDILEDTTLSEEGLRRKFGDTITDLVVAVTNKPGRNRMERHAATYPKIRANPTAVILKLADRIVNVEASLLNRGSKTHLLEVYREEHPGFEGGLGRGEERDPRCSNMWTHLASMIYR